MSAELSIDVETVRHFIELARAVSAGIESDYEDGHEHEVEFDATRHADKHAHDGLAEEEAEDLTGQELEELIGDLNDDEAFDLVALVWIGRGDFDGSDLDAARKQARERAEGPAARYLLGIPLLGDYLELGLAAIGR